MTRKDKTDFPDVESVATNYLRQSRILVAIVLLLSCSAIVVTGLDILMRSADQDRMAMQWMHRLDLSFPAYWPAGTVSRNPEFLSPAIDLRFTPFYGLGVDGARVPVEEPSGHAGPKEEE